MSRTKINNLSMNAMVTPVSRFFSSESCAAAAFLLFLVSVSLSVSTTYADRCILPITDADVYGPGQKAIVAWNGETERLILSTDLYASADTKVLEFLPLPSRPSVEEGRFESFEAIQNLMMMNLPRAAAPEQKAGLEIIFHDKIGAHDITVVRAASVKELSRFMVDYTSKMGVAQPDIADKVRQILANYLERGFNYWVFDLVDLHSTAKSIEPIVYEFQSLSLYYPLRVSTSAKGHTEVILYVITPEKMDEGSLPPKMRLARYIPSDQPILFQVTHEELASIDKKISALFGPMPLTYPPLRAAWLTAIKYEGDLSNLDFDLEIPPRPVPCRSIRVDTDKNRYALGEAVRITADFTHLKPGCVEITVLHSHEIRLEILDSNDRTIQSWHWDTDGDLHKTIDWKPNQADDYAIRAASWWDGEKLEVEALTSITISGSTPTPAPLDSEIRWLLYGVAIAVACILVGAGIVYLLIKPRSHQARTKHHIT